MVEAARMGIEIQHQDLRQYLVPIDVGLHLSDLNIANDEGPVPIICASQSQSRIGILKRNLLGNPVIGVSADPEPLEADVAQVALHKLGVVYRDRYPFKQRVPSIVIAADALTEVMRIGEANEILTVETGKPETLLQLPHDFYGLYHIALTHGIPPGYGVVTHSVLLHDNNHNNGLMLFEDGNRVKINLNSQMARRLATKEGLIEYILAFQAVYKGIVNPKFQLHKISGGIDLLALVRMGAVDAINGIEREDLHFEEMLKLATFIVTVGISPRLLRLLGVPEEEMIPQKSYIHLITDRAFHKNLLQ